MNEDTPRVHGVAEPKGVAWLQEVRIDAARNAVENLRRQAETREFEEAKARGITPEEIIRKGKEDLREADPSFAELDDSFEEPKEEGNEEVEELKKQLKAERAARTKAENKLKTQEDAKPVEGTPETESAKTPEVKEAK